MVLCFIALNFSIEPSLINQAIGITFKSIRDSDQLYLNGQLVASTGAMPPNFQKATLYSRYYFLPTHLIKTDSINTLEVKIFNHARYGGIVSSAPVIDSADKINYSALKHNSLMMLYIGMFIIITIIQIFYYVAQRNHREHLYFALLSFGQAIYLYTYSHFNLHEDINLNFVFRLNIFMFAYLSIFFCLFLTEFFKLKRNKIINALLLIILVSGLIQFTILPLDYSYHQVFFLDVIGLFFFLPLYFYLFYRSIKEDMPYAKIMSGAISIHLLMVVFDILIDLNILPHFFSGIAGMLSPISLMLVFITITLILTHRHWLYYRHATYDYLTDALRRSAFIERLAEEIPRSQRQKEPLMVALLDIDNFKQLNDQNSHIAGDIVLKEVVKRSRGQLREFDLLGRYGGDEFCIAASVANTADAMQLLKRVQQKITNESIIVSKELELDVTVTIGAYVAEPSSDFHPEMLIAEADQILVKGKINQKGKIHI